MCCGSAGLLAITSVYPNRAWCQHSASNSESDAFSWLASIRMPSEDVTCGKRMGGDSERLTSTVAS